ncbi:MAG: hypothetical protein H6739_01990 [Alphaproteobacteria bacterium]|nr:hypothetical protein [Alphaproteobacteria bacterium]
MAEPSEFYVGWQEHAPPRLGAFLRVLISALLFTVTLAGLGFTASHAQYAPSVFEFGQPRAVEGLLTLNPHPELLVERPGVVGLAPGRSRLLLVGAGKHGADHQLARLDGHRVRLQGALIYREADTMLELVPGSVEDLGLPGVATAAAAARFEDLGEWTLIGEIVDSKCFLGVMNPGNLKPHRACATRCISGGIPPLFLVRDDQGAARHLLLVGPEGQAINDRVLDVIAEPLEVTGRLERHHDRLVFKADPSDFRRLDGT